MGRKLVYLSLFGSTGSIGRQVLEVVDSLAGRLAVLALVSGGNNLQLLAGQIRKYRPRYVGLTRDRVDELRELLGGFEPEELIWGTSELEHLARLPEGSMVINAVSGAVGLRYSLAALEAGKRLALANKESLVVGGHLLSKYVGTDEGTLVVPIDSEHSAIFRCLQSSRLEPEKVILTASGGPFWRWPAEDLAHVTPDLALTNPNWAMGPRVTVDSATMVNKGLEVIEGHWLFNMPYQQIEVLVHEQSIVHSMVQFRDGSILAQLAVPDMRIPIQYALTWPEGAANGKWPRLDWSRVSSLSFAPPDYSRFPGLKLGYQAGIAGGSMPVVYNAADEVAVKLFLEGKIGFQDITRLIELAMERHQVIKEPNWEEIMLVDQDTRTEVRLEASKLGNVSLS